MLSVAESLSALSAAQGKHIALNLFSTKELLTHVMWFPTERLSEEDLPFELGQLIVDYEEPVGPLRPGEPRGAEPFQ